MHRIFLPTLCAMLLSGAPVFAGATFENTRSELIAQPDQDLVTASFPFKNDTESTLKVTKVHSNCGCIKATTDKTSYAPGESGMVVADFKVGNFEGLVEKFVTLETDAKDEPMQRLTVAITVPKLYEVEPQLTEWKQGEEGETKIVTFDVVGEEKIHVTEVSTSRDNFEVELVTIKEGEKYEIRLTPKNTDLIALGVLRIITDYHVKKHSRKLAFFGVVKETRAEKDAARAAKETAKNS